MRIEVSKLFEKDILLINDPKLASKLQAIINIMESTQSISEISGLKKIKGFRGYYRARIGNYRLGCKVDSDKILLLRFMNRKDIYNYFP